MVVRHLFYCIYGDFSQEGLMQGTYVVLVEGEALSNHQKGTYQRAYQNALQLAEGLSSIIEEGNQIILIYDNRPHIGFLLTRSAVSSTLLDPIPIDIAIGDSQGAIGSFLARGMRNMITNRGIHRRVTSVFTSVVVEKPNTFEGFPLRGIGPWFDRERAEEYQQIMDWKIVEDPGHGYRRAFYFIPPHEILEMEEINDLAAKGNMVICGGVGVPYFREENGELVNAEVLIETESAALMIANNIDADYFWIVTDSDLSFQTNGIALNPHSEMSLQKLEQLLGEDKMTMASIRSIFEAAARFLKGTGSEVMITTSKHLQPAMAGESGLTIR
jgi:carbamate kinase